jgi:hypothetical protein
MTHPTTEQLMTGQEDVLEHLETCARCRSSIDVDVSLDTVWQRVTAGIEETPISLTPPVNHGHSGWAAGVVAAIVVGALLLPVGFFALSNTGGSNVADEPPASEVGVVDPAVQLPERAPAPVDGDAGQLPAPPDTASFEMTFTAGDEIVGRLIWARPDYFEAVRVTIDPAAGPIFEYGLYRTGDGTGFSNPTDSALEWSFPSGETVEASLRHVASTPYIPDPDVPWDLLVPGDLSDTLATLGLTDDNTTDPTHHLATSAWDDGVNRVEATDDGIPVLIRRGDAPVFSVDSLERRTLYRGEVGNNVDVPVYYALHKATTTTPEQYDILANGIVTLADYQAAAVRAAECAGVDATFDNDAKLYLFPEEAADCVATWVSDIEQVWRLDAQLVTSDEWTAMYYEAMDMPEMVEMYRSEQGPERPLASGDGWAIAISERGPGYCTRTSVSPQGTYGWGCFTPSHMAIPGVLSLDSGWSYTDNEIDRGALLGIVTEEVERIEVTFSSGEVETIVPGGLTEFGFRGFGLLYDAGAIGVPTVYDLYSGGGLVSSYATGACDRDAEHTPFADTRAQVCG